MPEADMEVAGGVLGVSRRGDTRAASPLPAGPHLEPGHWGAGEDDRLPHGRHPLHVLQHRRQPPGHHLQGQEAAGGGAALRQGPAGAVPEPGGLRAAPWGGGVGRNSLGRSPTERCENIRRVLYALVMLCL